MHRHSPQYTQTTNIKSRKRLDLFKATADVNQFIDIIDISPDLHSYYLQCKWDLFIWGLFRIAFKYKPLYFRSISKDLKNTPSKVWKHFKKQFPKTKKETVKMNFIRTAPLLYSLLYMIFSPEARKR
jgi:hypothetical protein